MIKSILGVETYKKGDEKVYFTRILQDGKNIFECKGTSLSTEGVLLLLDKINKGAILSLGEYDKYVREAFK